MIIESNARPAMQASLPQKARGDKSSNLPGIGIRRGGHILLSGRAGGRRPQAGSAIKEISRRLPGLRKRRFDTYDL